ncbi:MAG: DUF1795 domain-containing protein [Deltaproteobacteria bacterium]|nr:DUF1795 domain-containing protein [Deltaproteobacteria bacterium]
MPVFHVDEGSYEVPESWEDSTINIHSVDRAGPGGFSFVVSRESLREGEELLDLADRQLAEVERSLDGFELIEKRQLAIDGKVALEAEFRWRNEAGVTHQRQAYVPCGAKVLIMTATAMNELSEEHGAQVTGLLRSFKFR